MCSTTNTVTITEPAGMTLNATATVPLCVTNTSAVSILVAGGIAPYQYKNGTGLNQPTNAFSVLPGTYTFTVTDANNCTKTITRTITASDNVAPVITCPANKTLYAGATCTSVGTALTATATDNCAVASVTYATTGVTSLTSPATGINDISGSTFNLGVTNVTYTAKDALNNTITCAFSITVVDTTKPVITCPANQTVNVTTGLCTGTAPGINANATDNCGVQSVTYSISGATVANSPATGINNASGVIFNKGLSTVTYTATDNSGNVKICSFTVTVNDNIAPIVVCPANTTSLTTASTCDVVVNNIAAVSTADNCGTVPTLTYAITGATTAASGATGLNNASSTTFNKGVSTVVYTATDASGNSGTCSFTVTVNDVTPPTLVCPPNQDLNLGATCTATVPTYTATVSDNCTGAITQTQSPAAGSTVTGAGTFPVTITATDANGVTNTCTFTVTKKDISVPTITCMGTQTINLGASCTVAAPNFTSLVAVADGCTPAGSLVVTQNPAAGTTLTGAGSSVFTFTVTDAANNSATCTAQVVRVDNTAPVITCPANANLYTGNTCSATLPAYTATASDNCTPSNAITFVQSPSAGTSITTLGANTLTITATDAAGNTSSCTFTVFLLDTTKPNIICPIVKIVNADAGSCVATNVTFTPPTIIEVCGGVTVTNNAPASFPIGISTFTFTATDASGNTKTCVQIVNVKDVQPPVVTCPANQTLTLPVGACSMSATNIAAVATDNCTVQKVLL
jgi:trimeric autotransporter adhesin